MSKQSKYIDVTVRLEVIMEPDQDTMDRFVSELDYNFDSRISDADIYDTKIINAQEVKPLGVES